MANPIFARNKQTGERRMSTDGGKTWVPAPMGVAPPAKLTNPDRKVLNELSSTANEARQVQQIYRDAQGAVSRLKPGPWRGRLMDMAIPEEGGGILDTIGGYTVGPIARMLGVINDQDVSDFQRLKGLQSQRVLSEQIKQKGPQTNTDAARMQMTEISPYKTPKANRQIVESGARLTQTDIERADFFNKWAARYGLNGLNEQGQSAAQVWDRMARNVRGPDLNKPGKRTGKVVITRID